MTVRRGAVPPSKSRPRLTAGKTKRAEQSLSEPLLGWVDDFRRGRPSVQAEDVPKCLDLLLDFNSAELERFVAEQLKLRVLNLRDPNGRRIRRVTPELVVQLLGGWQSGCPYPLVTTAREVRLRIREGDEQLRRLVATRDGRPSPRLLALVTERQRLLSMARQLRELPRKKGLQQFGFAVGLLGAFVKEKPFEFKPDALARLLGQGTGVSVGVRVSEADRRTGKRKVIPYWDVAAKNAVGGASYVYEFGGEKGWGWKLCPLFFSFGYSHHFGRNIAFRPFKLGLTLGERTLAIGKMYGNAQYKGIAVYPGAGILIQGDPIHSLVGPVVRPLFDFLERGRDKVTLRMHPKPPADTASAQESRDSLPHAVNI